MRNLVIDISYFIHRHVDSKAYIQRDGIGGGVVAILLSINKIMREVYPADRLWVCFDGEPTYRQTIYPEYKANRENSSKKNMSQRLTRAKLAATLRDIFETLGARVILNDSLEADDCAYQLGLQLAERSEEAMFATGDQDWLQILALSDKFSAYSPRAKTTFTGETFKSMMGFPASMLVYYKALCGDKSDNIPNIRQGLGEATAKKIILESGYNGETILNNFAIGEDHAVLQALTRNMQLVDCGAAPIPQAVRDEIKLAIEEPRERDELRLLEHIQKLEVGDRLDWLVVANRWKALQ